MVFDMTKSRPMEVQRCFHQNEDAEHRTKQTNLFGQRLASLATILTVRTGRCLFH